MVESQTKSVTSFTPASLVVDAILVLGFFSFMFVILQPHVPSNEMKYVYLWSGLTAACMSAVFWLCVQMFRAVFRFQHQKK
jgi:hypothetical protein